MDIKSEKEQDAFIEILFKLGNLEGKKLLVLDDIKDIDLVMSVGTQRI